MGYIPINTNIVKNRALGLVAEYMVYVVPNSYFGDEKRIGILICQEIFKEIYINKSAPLIVLEDYLDELEVHNHRCGFESRVVHRIGTEVTNGIIKRMS